MVRRSVLARGALWVAVVALSAPAFAQEDDEPPAPWDEPAAAEQAAPPASLARIVICEEVRDRVPIGEAERFPNDVGTLWCFTKVVDADAPLRIFHRWYVGDTLMDEIPMTVEAKSWRCWSYKTIWPSWSGPCRVEILTESGDVIGTKEFTLFAPPAAEASEG